MSGGNILCCCDCNGIGLPIWESWTRNRLLWSDQQISYVVGDLVYATDDYYYICIADHISADKTNPNGGEDAGDVWNQARREFKCLYLDISSIGLANCRPLWNPSGADPADTNLWRLKEIGSDPPYIKDKVLIKQKNFGSNDEFDEDGAPFNGINVYSQELDNASCGWFYKCNCSGTEPVEIRYTTVNAVKQRFLHRGDCYKSSFLIQVVFTSQTAVEIVIHQRTQMMRSSAYDGNTDREQPPTKELSTSNTPCKYYSAPGFSSEVYRATGVVGDPYVDAVGDVVATISTTSDYSCSNIGDLLFSHGTLFNYDTYVAGGGGSVDIVAPFVSPWTPANAAASCSTIASPSNDDCGKGDPPIPPDCPPGEYWDGERCVGDPPPPPPPCPDPPCDGDPDPDPEPDPPDPKKPKYYQVYKCGGGATIFWVPASDGGKFSPGNVFKICIPAGDYCVYVSQHSKRTSNPPRLLSSASVCGYYGRRGCRKCLEHWDVVGCPGSTFGTLHTDSDLSAYEGQTVEVVYADSLGTLDPIECGTISRAAHPIDTEFVIIGATLTCKECADCCICGDCEFSSNSTLSVEYEKSTAADDPFPKKGYTLEGTLDYDSCGTWTGTLTYHNIDQRPVGDPPAPPEDYEEEHTVSYGCGSNEWNFDSIVTRAALASLFDPDPQEFDDTCEGFHFNHVTNESIFQAGGSITNLDITVEGNGGCEP